MKKTIARNQSTSGSQPQKSDDSFSKLLEKIDKARLPKHIAIIMDGNGRWAAKRGLPRLAGHRAGAKAIRSTIEIANQIKVKYLTLYTFSAENWRRPRKEVFGLMSLFEETLNKEVNELNQKNVRIKTIGDLTRLRKSTRNKFLEAEEKTKANTGLNLIVAINYGGRQEIVQAVRKCCSLTSSQEIDERKFASLLYTADIPDPELIIRTSGEFRISNFLLWQAAYAEFWITNTLWPDFTKEEFLQAIHDFQHRQRRFGRVN
jgi:undecaprenyl diphosphate synthase